MAKTAELHEVAVTKLRPYERNAKIHSPEQVEKIAESIKAFGFLSPVLIDREFNIIAGHGRVMAAQKIGMTEIPCVFVEGLTPEQRRAYILADNRLAELAEWDMQLVDQELEELADADFDVTLTGFEFDIDEEEQAEIVEDDFPEDVETRCKPGDVWQLGDHRLICGDCTDITAIEKLMDGAVADIAITSPPYGEADSAKLRDHYVKGAEKRQSLYNQHADNKNEWEDLIRGSFDGMRIASRAQFINIQMLADNKKPLAHFVADNADSFVDVIIWDKTKAPPQMQKNVLNNQFEFVFVFQNDNGSRSIPFADFHGNVNNVFQLKTGNNEFADVHRAVFPTAFPAKIMEIASKAETVLDVFGGTGTTMIACEQLNRKCYMCEIDPHYCDVIINRWETFTGREAVLING